jgi:hypothetical protein
LLRGTSTTTQDSLQQVLQDCSAPTRTKVYNERVAVSVSNMDDNSPGVLVSPVR